MKFERPFATLSLLFVRRFLTNNEVVRAAPAATALRLLSRIVCAADFCVPSLLPARICYCILLLLFLARKAICTLCTLMQCCHLAQGAVTLHDDYRCICILNSSLAINDCNSDSSGALTHRTLVSMIYCSN